MSESSIYLPSAKLFELFTRKDACTVLVRPETAFRAARPGSVLKRQTFEDVTDLTQT